MNNSIKKILGIIIIIILTATCTVVAQTIIKSNEVTYDNSKSKGSFDNVQESLDELYQKAGYTGEEYHEEILHGADPVLSGELIPVYLADNGDVYYANIHTKWYSYEYKKWANAVILVDDAYSKNKYSVGDKICEEDIESYFVWIPRYAYKLWDIDSQKGMINVETLTNETYELSPAHIRENNRIIEIVFGTKDYLEGQKYKSLIRNNITGVFSEPNDLAVNNYLQHPAFTLGAEELNGFWMGKFEVGYNQTNTGASAITGTSSWTTATAQVDSTASNKIVVKPNVNSWRNIKVGNMFNTAKGYNTDLKSHMLKNTEWGAVAYLSHSKYGKAGKININNASDYKTGYSALPNTNQAIFKGDNDLSGLLSEEYNTSTGYMASTTGNITGVYDMAGGAWESMAAAMVSNRTNDASGLSSDFVTAQMKEGYIDAYPEDSAETDFTKRILGDATGELAPFYKYREESGIYYHSSWYGNGAYFISNISPWFTRGGAFTDGVLASRNLLLC